MRLYKFFLFIIFLGLQVSNALALSWQNDKIILNGYQFENKILIKAQMLNGWHISWENSGDAGAPVEFDWQLPTGISIEKINQSIPQKFLYEEILTLYGYDNTAYYLFEMSPFSKDNITLNINWTACKDYCKPEQTSFIFSAHTAIGADEWSVLYNQAIKTFPVSVKWKASTSYQIDSLKITIKNAHLDPKTQPLYFAPYQRDIIPASALQKFSLSPEHDLIIEAERFEDSPLIKRGLLIYGSQAFDINFLQENGLQIPWTLLIMAFIAGLILNLMPCVFPVLSLKALSLVKSASQKGHFLSGLSYMLGVVLSFICMAVILYILHQSGKAIGWGFQLQSKGFIFSMLLLFLILFLMIIGAIQIKGRFLNFFERFAKINSFMTGFFAVLIATPCTGPVMGAVLGYAFMQPAQIYFPVFLSLGLGYALPFTLIEFFPNFIIKILPKPDKWLSKVKYIFAVPIFLTCVWLAWLLAHQLFNLKDKNTIWQEYNPFYADQLVQKGESVFIDFTAKWCITCLVNAKTSLHRLEFEEYAQKHNIHLFKADWTNHDEVIYHVLNFYGRSSIPLYVYYKKNSRGQYIILPQLLTLDKLIEYLDGQNQSDN